MATPAFVVAFLVPLRCLKSRTGDAEVAEAHEEGAAEAPETGPEVTEDARPGGPWELDVFVKLMREVTGCKEKGGRSRKHRRGGGGGGGGAGGACSCYWSCCCN